MPNEDQVKGTLKEAEGKLTGDDSREKEGKAQGAWGDVKEHAGDLKDDLKD
jgi:uncharacterized protein YjbJ (UPF0337 family)